MNANANSKAFGKRLKELLKQHGWSQGKLSKHSGLDPASINCYLIRLSAELAT